MAYIRPPSHYVLTWSFLGAWGGRGKGTELSGVSSHRDTNPVRPQIKNPLLGCYLASLTLGKALPPSTSKSHIVS